MASFALFSMGWHPERIKQMKKRGPRILNNHLLFPILNFKTPSALASSVISRANFTPFLFPRKDFFYRSSPKLTPRGAAPNRPSFSTTNVFRSHDLRPAHPRPPCSPSTSSHANHGSLRSSPESTASASSPGESR